VGLGVDHPRQRGVGCAQRIGDQRRDVGQAEVADLNALDRQVGRGQLVEGMLEGVLAIDLVVAVGEAQHQVGRAAQGQCLHNIERDQVAPLQVIEEQQERLLGRREQADEAQKDESEAILGLDAHQLLDRVLRADQGLQAREGGR